ncbi:uracil-DNA glycosylase family protein [Secundilactobacillus malefermentans]|uniref:uracil-DNA glycosylase family protein n=1 Tax=Secundilactobacillus malefermentans TaxID=176292 RepID=UPI00164FC4A7|nr:uracil-DNA glycosylase family protein [Secundilactobacillus malefermentans]
MMQLSDLNSQYDKMQLMYGDANFHSVYGGGATQQPKTMFVFMNPTGRNVSTALDWQGRRAPWIGTKPIWRLFHDLDLVDDTVWHEIDSKRGKDWTPEFAEEVYQDVSKHDYFLTNLAKCTFAGTAPVSNKIYRQYLAYLLKEIEITQPKKIVAFGNQVSSILLGQALSVSTTRQNKFDLLVANHHYPVYPTYYPVGNGTRNLGKAVEDLMEILN